MNREEIQSLMADYLGGELNAAEKARFESALGAHPDLEREAAELTRTLSMIHFADPVPGDVQERRENAGPSENKRTGKSLAGTVMRYAAAMIIAYIAGVYSYALIADPGSRVTSRPGSARIATPGETPDSTVAKEPSMKGAAMKEVSMRGSAMNRASMNGASPKWETAFVGTYTQPQHRSRLARSWIALSSTLRDG